MFSLICAWIHAWVNNGEVGDLRRHRAHYDVTVMGLCHYCSSVWLVAYTRHISFAENQPLCSVASVLRSMHFICFTPNHNYIHGLGFAVFCCGSTQVDWRVTPLSLGLVLHCPRAPFTHGLTLLPACLSNPMSNNVWDKNTYPFLNFNGFTVGVWECISNFSPHLIMEIITYHYNYYSWGMLYIYIITQISSIFDQVLIDFK